MQFERQSQLSFFVMTVITLTIASDEISNFFYEICCRFLKFAPSLRRRFKKWMKIANLHTHDVIGSRILCKESNFSIGNWKTYHLYIYFDIHLDSLVILWYNFNPNH